MNHMAFSEAAQHDLAHAFTKIIDRHGKECFKADSVIRQPPAIPKSTHASVTFTNADMMAPRSDHNRPLYIIATLMKYLSPLFALLVEEVHDIKSFRATSQIRWCDEWLVEGGRNCCGIHRVVPATGRRFGASTAQSLESYFATRTSPEESRPSSATSKTSQRSIYPQISGHLPSVIISWTSLATLNLSRNQLSGEIPSAIGFLPDLIDLDLSENQFSGQIPPEIGLLRLTSLNLSSNQLTGRIPAEFENLAFDGSFLNNHGLCARKPIINLRACYSEPRESRNLSSRLLSMVLVLAIAVFLVAVFFALLMIRHYLRKKHGRDIANWKLISFQRLNFTESNILSSLIENNLIWSGGSGKVYHVTINHSGEAVAVKRIWNNRKLDQNLEKEFLAEVQILGTIRHSNIVKLLCCISNENSKLLVYEYMENCSLDRWLHAKKRSLSVSGSALSGTLLQTDVWREEGWERYDVAPLLSSTEANYLSSYERSQPKIKSNDEDGHSLAYNV
ncbi:hypothetical protein HHK36_006233 [Tetracentron sinense]|uniref:Protein kinase domain-containing protein n=1 Tax=Tetracentron sinense TaxID=13715 RepID=A0A834ZL63_TETSI|nr:hypothetical protein HHK36_006233 [Tetracentron sinense]